MEDHEMDPNLALTGEFDAEEYDEDDKLGLDSAELWRIQFFAEHPELSDPLIWFLPRRAVR
jgi:hypothetical protein